MAWLAVLSGNLGAALRPKPTRGPERLWPRWVLKGGLVAAVSSASLKSGSLGTHPAPGLRSLLPLWKEQATRAGSGVSGRQTIEGVLEHFQD